MEGKYPCLLTIIMPAHNAAKYIGKTIESFLLQQFTDWRLIIIDDFSKDDTWGIIQEWQQKDNRILGVQNETNLKVARTMNKGIAMVESPYFARVDSDDVLLPDHFLKIVTFLDNHPDIDICGSQVITIDGDGNFRRKWNYETDPSWIKMSAIFACPFLQSSVVMRSSVIRNSEGYRPEMELVEDYELWIRLLRNHKAANIPDYTIQYRIHDNNMSEVNKTKILILLEKMYLENANFYAIDHAYLKWHAKMEVGVWDGFSMVDFSTLKKWKDRLLRLGAERKLADRYLYNSIVSKYFTNAYLKIATQNRGKVKVFALLNAIKESPKWGYVILKRKRANAKR